MSSVSLIVDNEVLTEPLTMASKVQLHLDHDKMEIDVHDGLMMIKIYEPVAEHLPKVKAMGIRDDDILLCSFPKSGTHWLYRVIDMLQRGRAVYDARNADSTFLDAQQVEKMAELDSPRLLVTHLPMDRLPDQAITKRTKIVHVYRNPRAVLVSFYFQMKGVQSKIETGQMAMTLDIAVNNMIEGKMPYGGWFSYMDKVVAFEQQHPDHPLCHLSYEEMSLNPLDTVKKLAVFLGKDASPEFCAEIVEACSFKKQKETEEQTQSQAALKFYRKGDMNDWKNHITVAQNEKLEAILKERVSKCLFSAKY